MIVVKMMGGLGNQIFQYAYARHLQEIYGDEIVLDISAYNKYKIRNFSLENLNIDVSMITSDVNEIINIDKNYAKIIRRQRKYRVLQKISKIILGNDSFKRKYFFRNINKGEYFNFSPYYFLAPEVTTENKYIYGYFQTDKFFYNINILDDCSLKTPLSKIATEYLSLINKVDSSAISIRWGEDYKKLENFNICDKDYYYLALDEMTKNKTIDQLIIFTDEVEKVKEDFDFSNYANEIIIIEKVTDYESLFLMSQCSDFIISNSSFSWLGAYLSKRKVDKKIYVPEIWYKDYPHLKEIYTKDMIKIRI
jgi:hypothetical protein